MAQRGKIQTSDHLDTCSLMLIATARQSLNWTQQLYVLG